MNSTKRAARIAGVLYLMASIPGAFGLIYVPSVLIVSGDAAATARNIAASETLFRAGILAHVIGQACFIFVAFALYRLLKGVNQRLAVLMVTLIVVSIPISLVNELNHVAVLRLASASGPAAALGKAQTEGLVDLFLRLYGSGILIAEIFWGLWLFPFGLLVIRSGFLPRVLGVLLLVAGVGWVVQSCTSMLSPPLWNAIHGVVSVLKKGELLMILWLLIVGAKDEPLEE